jgi:guanylate kinase
VKTKGKLIAVTAPSGSGKTTIVREILKLFPEIIFSVSATTRAPRQTEIDGVNYFFITEEEFLKKIENDDFVEWQNFYDYYYGTLRSFIDDNINSGKSVLLEIEVKGALSIKKLYPDSHIIYICPPSYDELVNRLRVRNTETEEDFVKRIERAKMELSLKNEFDYIIVNENLENAVKESTELVKKIISKEQ